MIVAYRFLTALGLLVATVCPTLMPAHTLAKAELEHTTPADGDTLDALPDQIDLWFAEAFDPATMQVMVIAPNSARIDNGVVEVAADDPERKHVTVAPLPAGDEGHYTVHVLAGLPNSADESSESFSFSVEGGGTCSSSPGAATAGTGARLCLPTPPELTPGEGILLENGANVDVGISSNRAGPVDITVTLVDAGGNPFPEARVWVRARHLEMEHGEFPHEAAGDGSGHYTAKFVGMGMGGNWRIAIDVIIVPGQTAQTLFVFQTMEGL
jgi:methionine-rich copper-binding protein CopC